MTRHTKAEIAESLAKLREWIKPGDSIYLTVESVSRSGMSRWIKPRLARPYTDSTGRDVVDFSYPAWRIACVLGLRYDDKNSSVRMDGCGMDMGFALVSCLAQVLFGQPGKYEAMPEAIEAFKVRGHRGRNGADVETAAEYMLKHRWI